MKLKRLIPILAVPNDGAWLVSSPSVTEQIGHALMTHTHINLSSVGLICANQPNPTQTATRLAIQLGIEYKAAPELACTSKTCDANAALSVIKEFEMVVDDLLVVIENPMDIILPSAFGTIRLHDRCFPIRVLDPGHYAVIDVRARVCQFVNIGDLRIPA